MLKKGQNETVKPREKTWFNPNIINITSTTKNYKATTPHFKNYFISKYNIEHEII